MAAVDSSYAAYLKAAAMYVTAAGADAALWPDGVTLERASPFATADGGNREGARQAAFLGGNTVRDVAIVPGRKAYLIGRAIIGRTARLGYDAGVAVFVIGAEEQDNGTTKLTVLRKLR